MNTFFDKISNLAEYFGKKSNRYYHQRPIVAYDKDDWRKYYLDFSARIEYTGPRDNNRIPVYQLGDITSHLPVQICLYTLGCWQKNLAQPDEALILEFRNCIDWLLKHQDAEGRWMSPFDKPKFNLKAPFPSAMVQGLAISCLVRAFDMDQKEIFLEAAELSLKSFTMDKKVGGVTTHENDFVFYDEYPTVPPRHVLNGFVYALWGLYDLYRCTDHKRAKGLFDKGIATLEKYLPEYDIGHWSLYHIPSKPRNPSTMHYHILHIDQMDVLHQITGERIFLEYKTRWQSYLDNRYNAIRTIPSKLWWDLTG